MRGINKEKDGNINDEGEIVGGWVGRLDNLLSLMRGVKRNNVAGEKMVIKVKSGVKDGNEGNGVINVKKGKYLG
ncbi:hypothetical protein [Staphylococcus epidermidis]|uniref:hypothetical protein n=1 Tax=Staphylococcus epidermidis TaxID=1282 RepID=UPI0011A03D6D|nr:hypothetical protein [Staphylococcus epidermidis]